MTKFLAYFALTSLGILNMLGLYWYGFGLWPQNWWIFIIFTIVNIVLFALRLQIEDGKK